MTASSAAARRSPLPAQGPQRQAMGPFSGAVDVKRRDSRACSDPDSAFPSEIHRPCERRARVSDGSRRRRLPGAAFEGRSPAKLDAGPGDSSVPWSFDRKSSHRIGRPRATLGVGRGPWPPALLPRSRLGGRRRPTLQSQLANRRVQGRRTPRRSPAGDTRISPKRPDSIRRREVRPRRGTIAPLHLRRSAASRYDLAILHDVSRRRPGLVNSKKRFEQEAYARRSRAPLSDR